MDIDKYIYKFCGFLDKFLEIIETASSRINKWVWNKRFGTRKGTARRTRVEKNG